MRVLSPAWIAVRSPNLKELSGAAIVTFSIRAVISEDCDPLEFGIRASQSDNAASPEEVADTDGTKYLVDFLTLLQIFSIF